MDSFGPFAESEPSETAAGRLAEGAFSRARPPAAASAGCTPLDHGACCKPAASAVDRSAPQHLSLLLPMFVTEASQVKESDNCERRERQEVIESGRNWIIYSADKS